MTGEGAPAGPGAPAALIAPVAILCSFGTNYFSDFSDEEWENYGTPAEDLVEFDKLFRSKSFVSLEDLRELNARLEREGEEKRSSGAWQSKHWFR